MEFTLYLNYRDNTYTKIQIVFKLTHNMVK